MKLARLKHILGVFAKYEFDDFILRSGIKKYLPRYRRASKKSHEITVNRATNLRLALEELGPTFIKLGQFISSRPDILPTEFLQELQKLQDHAPRFPSEQAMAMIAAEMPQPVEEIFATVKHEPEASASLAQIHSAVLRTGEDVVLKVQRPDILAKIKMDIEVMYGVAALIDRYSSWAKYYGFTAFVIEFERVILEELDFHKEARNIERLDHNLRYFEHIHLPKVYWPYSNKRVLVLEHIRGTRLENINSRDLSVSTKHLAEEILEAYLKQIVEDGFFHADPHLGNLIFEPSGRVTLIDMGAVGHLDADLRLQIGQLLLSFSNQEAERVTDVLIKIGASKEVINVKHLEQEIRAIISNYHFLTAEDLGIGQAIIALARTAVSHKLTLPQSFNLLCKTLFYVDVVIKSLAPQLDYMEFIRRSTLRVFTNLIQEQYNASRLTEVALESNRLLLDSPNRLNLLLDKLVRDEISIKFEHGHLEGMFRTLHQAANRLSFAIVVGALVVGTSQLMSVQVGRTFLGYPILGILGFIFAGLFGFYLLIRILRTENL